jgi:excisionase family DNA binding protein
MEMNPELALSVEQARLRLGLSRGLMYEAVKRGEIPSIRIGRRILIPKSALLRLLDGNQYRTVKPMTSQEVGQNDSA